MYIHIFDNAATAKSFDLTAEAIKYRQASRLGASEELRQEWIRHYRESESTARPVRFEYVYKIDALKNQPTPKIITIGTEVKTGQEEIGNQGHKAAHNLGEELSASLCFQPPNPKPQSILIRIRDNGCGIPSKIKNKIFDPFFTTKPVGQGTGLGLSISYQIIKKHGGQIEVKSQPGQGTEFVITVPLTNF